MVLNALDLFGNCHFGHTVSPFWFFLENITLQPDLEITERPLCERNREVAP